MTPRHLGCIRSVSWRHLVFFRIRTMIKREYFNRFLEIDEDLDQSWDYIEK